MADYSYLQPAVGRPFATLLEGTHNNLLMLDAFAGRYVLICCLGSGFHEARPPGPGCPARTAERRSTT